jgi:hypothetical protein
MKSRLVVLVLVVVAGCVEQEKLTLVPPGSPQGPVVQTAGKLPHAPATEEAALRVVAAGRQVITANPQIGIRPQFLCIGTPEAVLFHQLQRDSCVVYISEGLVKQCRDEVQLIAVLCSELGHVASERATMVQPALPRPERRPPPAMAVGRDETARFGAADGTHLFELAQIDQECERAAVTTPPSPDALARKFLERTGNKVAELQAIEPLLRAAEKNTAFDRMATGRP